MDAKTLFMRTLAEPNDIFLKSKGFFFFFSFFFLFQYNFIEHTLVCTVNIHKRQSATRRKLQLEADKN